MDSHFTNLVEALIFAAPEPIDEQSISQIIGCVNDGSIREAVERLNSEYERGGHAFRIISGAGGYRFATQPEYSPWVKRLVIGSGRVRLSRAALETVSLIAYRQPISRAEIETIRGVDVSGVLKLLLERRLVNVVGRGKGVGRPLLYSTTPEFLRHFGIDSLEDLPEFEEFTGPETERSDDQSEISFRESDS